MALGPSLSERCPHGAAAAGDGWGPWVAVGADVGPAAVVQSLSVDRPPFRVQTG